MIRPLVFAFMLCLGFTARSEVTAGDGIHVGKPKIYSDRYLRERLVAIQQRLSAVQGIDNAAVASKLGGLQGGTSTQTNVSLSALGRSTPGVTTEETAATKTTTTQAEAKPTIPSAPAASALALPATVSVSALDLLSEQVQLAYQVTSLQLLLEGALSDQFQLRGGGKRRLTLGVPISIDRAAGTHERDFAEVEITICNSPLSKAAGEAPTIVTLLPQEKTYNTVSITDNSVGISAGAIAGVFNVSGGWFRSTKTMYAIKQQDTVGIIRAPAQDVRCGLRQVAAAGRPIVRVASEEEAERGDLDAVYAIGGGYFERIPRVTFAWQIRPTLGRKGIDNGLRNHFVQVALPDVEKWFCSGGVYVRTSWQRATVKWWDAPSEPTKRTAIDVGEIVEYDTKPYAFDVAALDLGDGNVLINGSGVFLDNLRIRAGATLLDSSTADYFVDNRNLRFKMPADRLAQGNIFLVSSTGEERRLIAYPTFVNPYRERSCSSDLQNEAMPLASAGTAGAPSSGTVPSPSTCKASEGDSLIEIDEARIMVSPYSDTTSLVRIPLSINPNLVELKSKGCFPEEHAARLPLIAVVGGKTYGLRNAPFEKGTTASEIRVLVPTESLIASPLVKVERILGGPWYSSGWKRAFDARFVVNKVTAVSEGDVYVYALTGAGLDKVCMVTRKTALPGACANAAPAAEPGDTGPPNPSLALTAISGSLALISVPKSLMASTKTIFLADDSGYIASVVLPKDDKVKDDKKDEKPKAAAATLEEPKDGLAVGAPSLTVDGSSFDQIAAIKYLEKEIPYSVGLDGKKLTIELPAGFSATEGIRFLDVTHLDKSATRLKVAVKAQRAARNPGG